MIGIGLAFILVGIVFLFIIPWVGIPVGIIGLILAVLYVTGIGRRAHRGRQPTQPGP
jgi:Flp pilus assembly protein TadB